MISLQDSDTKGRQGSGCLFAARSLCNPPGKPVISATLENRCARVSQDCTTSQTGTII